MPQLSHENVQSDLPCGLLSIERDYDVCQCIKHKVHGVKSCCTSFGKLAKDHRLKCVFLPYSYFTSSTTVCVCHKLTCISGLEILSLSTK